MLSLAYREVPLFVPEWSVWESVIGRHYEVSSKDAKDFLYELVIDSTKRVIPLAAIPNQLTDVLRQTYSDRPALAFLVDAIPSESLPALFTRLIPKEASDGMPHQLAVFLLALWKSIGVKEVYIVADGQTQITEFEAVLKAMTSRIGISFVRVKIVDCVAALSALKSFQATPSG